MINLYFYGLLPECVSDFKDILDKLPCESDMDYIQVGGWLKSKKGRCRSRSQCLIVLSYTDVRGV